MERLPRGRHGLPPSYVAQNQRDRLIAAVTGILYENGYDRTTVSLIGERAHVSKSDFYRHFSSKDTCFLAAYDANVAKVRESVAKNCATEGGWVDKVCESLSALLRFLAGEPACANLVLVEGLRAGPSIYGRFQAALAAFVPDLQDGAPGSVEGEAPPRATAEAVVGGIASLLGRHVLAGETEQLSEFFPEVAEFALTPYVGAAEARRIISRG